MGELMRRLGVRPAAIAVFASMMLSQGSSVAGAAEDWGIHGTFTATSDGVWAKTNEVYRPEAVLRSRWTITSTCTSSITCTGTVSSDQGWSAPIYTKTGIWYLRRNVPGWEPCADGTTADGLQIFRFYGADLDATRDPDSSTFQGEDTTTGPSGACGRNESLEIRMPFQLVLSD